MIISHTFILDSNIVDHIPNGIYWITLPDSCCWEVVSVAGNRYFKVGEQLGYELNTAQEYRTHSTSPVMSMCFQWIAKHLLSFRYGRSRVTVDWIDELGSIRKDEVKIPKELATLSNDKILQYSINYLREKY